jgi:hypothetical protein
MMNIREEARKRGGEEAVKLLDRSVVVQEEVGNALNKAITDVIDKHCPNDSDPKWQAFVASAIAQAVAEVYGAATVATWVSTGKKDGKLELITVGIRAFVSALERAFDNHEANEMGVADMIVGADKKVKEEKGA